MVRIFKGLYINPLTIVFFVVCYLSGKTDYFIVSYVSMLVHELAHLCAAVFLGLKPSHVVLHPFGVNLKLKTTILCGLSDDIILYLSGPLVNLFLALFFGVVFGNDYGVAVNIMLFFVNIFPVCPLDGGNIAKRILVNFFSENTVSGIMKSISAFVSISTLLGGVYVAKSTGYNYSVIFLSALIFANIFTDKEKYSEAAIKNLMYEKKLYANKNEKPVHMYVSEGGFEPCNYIKYIRPGAMICVAVLDERGEVKKIVSEKEIISVAIKSCV